MRLAKVTLAGFKSFADPVDFKFDAQRVGIVGPNGCGKSNVVDAVKWVLGERSAKSLRGAAMLDVIFAGSAVRKPLGAATVTLSFDNPADEKGQRTLPLDSDNVDVARRLYRDGRSEYLINGQKVRLKDVKDIFIDTGVGTAAYCIIEQGRVAKLVDASPLERRGILEEAAGVAKFKLRRVEAERKLERTETNLVRTREQLASTERRLRIVRSQAEKARSFRDLDLRFREQRTTLAMDQFDEIQTRLVGLTSRLADLGNQRTALQEEVTRLEASYQEAEVSRHELRDELHLMDQRMLELEGTIEKLAFREEELTLALQPRETRCVPAG